MLVRIVVRPQSAPDHVSFSMGIQKGAMTEKRLGNTALRLAHAPYYSSRMQPFVADAIQLHL